MQTEPYNNEQLQSALAAVWQKCLPVLRQRVSVIERASEQIRAGALDAELREQARQEAHRLAGLLGTFGYHEGTEAARSIELALETTVSEEANSDFGAALAILHRTVR